MRDNLGHEKKKKHLKKERKTKEEKESVIT